MLRKVIKGYKAFTLIELVMVIVIIGILAAVAIPMYIALQGNAREAQEEGSVGGIRGGISVWHASALINSETVVWPTVLDDAADAATTVLFASVLDTPISSGWSKTSDTVYVANAGTAEEATYTYSTANGSFAE